jgi:1-acyl-sn-glycerol-3-phosphate acyltransferase
MSLSKKFENVIFEKFKTKNEILDNTLIKFICFALKNISGVENFENFCKTKFKNLNVSENIDDIFRALEIKPYVYYNDIENLKNQYIIVSNHPTGPMDGIFIPKVFNLFNLKGKILGDDIMTGMDHMKDSYMGLSLRLEGKSRITQLRNLKKEILNGSTLGIFPAGSVSHFDVKRKQICDNEWNPGFIDIAKSNNLDILPVYIDANLSILHYIFKYIYDDIASLRLFKEASSFVEKNKGKTIEIYVGSPISVSTLEPTDENAQKIKEICENLMFQNYTKINY